MNTDVTCPCCGGPSSLLREVERYEYFRCLSCGSLFIDPAVIDDMDAGRSLVTYTEDYWQMEMPSTRERAFGPGLARAVEAVIYCRRPIRNFLDIGTGPGYLLDALGKYLPGSSSVFKGVEKFPPPSQYRTKSKNYIVGSLADIEFQVDCGVCIEVVEHLTPKMLNQFLGDLAQVSSEQALYIINTGLPCYVMNEDPAYLDPTVRGHVVSYSLPAIANIAAPHDFTLFPLKGKSWAFVLEYKSAGLKYGEFSDRIWDCPPENTRILEDPEMGSAMKILAMDTARAYPALADESQNPEPREYTGQNKTVWAG